MHFKSNLKLLSITNTFFLNRIYSIQTVVKRISAEDYTQLYSLQCQSLSSYCRLEFLISSQPLSIFSSSYDIVIEQFCESYGKTYTDGFTKAWERSSFRIMWTSDSTSCVVLLLGQGVRVDKSIKAFF